MATDGNSLGATCQQRSSPGRLSRDVFTQLADFFFSPPPDPRRVFEPFLPNGSFICVMNFRVLVSRGHAGCCQISVVYPGIEEFLDPFDIPRFSVSEWA